MFCIPFSQQPILHFPTCFSCVYDTIQIICNITINIHLPPASHYTTKMSETISSMSHHQNLGLLLLYCTFSTVGSIGYPFLQRLYYIHGGNLKWLISFLQSAGFFMLLPPLAFLYFKSKLPSKAFFMDLKLFFASVVIGIMFGFTNYMYSAGLSYLPVSTSSLLVSTQLAFTAFFAYLIVKLKFTFYTANSVLVITLGAVVLSLHTSGDRPVGVTQEKYLFGFFFTLAAAAVAGLTSPLIELAYSKSSKSIDSLMLLQVQVVINASSTAFCAVGMIIRNDFKVIPIEAKHFALGEGKYYLILAGSVIACQLAFLGVVGIIMCKSSLFNGIFSSGLLPVIEVASVLTFHEKFTGEKALSLALCLWGFASYFIGESQKTREHNHELVELTPKDSFMDENFDLGRPNQVETLNRNGEKILLEEV